MIYRHSGESAIHRGGYATLDTGFRRYEVFLHDSL